ncbi:MAG TPA: hypothetical protein VK066_18280 [Chloroflexota bacterium]|nr:hypothetical protein [Chloroflexota bacterium]
MALLLLVSLVPVASAQLPTTCGAGTGCVAGVVVDGNTREPIAEVVNILVIPGAPPGPGQCAGAAGINPVTSIAALNATIQTQVTAVIGTTNLNLNCTSVSSNTGRWGFNTVPAAAGGTTYQHIAIKVNYATHTDTLVVVGGGGPAAPVEHDYSLSLTVGAAGGQPGATSGVISGVPGAVALTACTVPPLAASPCSTNATQTPGVNTNGTVGFNAPPLIRQIGQPAPLPVPNPQETLLGTLVAAVETTGAAPGTVVAANSGPLGDFTLTVPAAGAAGTWRVFAINSGGNVPGGPGNAQTVSICASNDICGHAPSAAPGVSVTVGPGATASIAAAGLTMPLKRAPSGNPAGFNGGIIPAGGGTATQTSVDNDIGAFGFVIDLTTGLPVNGVTVTATCTSGNCANNISAVTSQPTNVQPNGATTGYYQLGGLTRGTQYTFRVTAVPAGFRIVDSCQVSVTTPPGLIANPAAAPGLPAALPTWFDPNLCVESLSVLQPIPGTSVLTGRVVDPIQLNAGAPTSLGGVTVVAVRTDASLVGSFISPFTGFTEATPTTQTDAGGNWVMAGLPPGTYRITALDNVDVLCLPGGTAPPVQLVSIPGGIARPAQTVGCGHIPASQPPAGQPGILAPPDAVTVVPDIVMPPKPAPNTSLATPGGAGSLPPAPLAVPAAAGTGGGIFGYVWDGVLGSPAQGATVQVRAVAALGPEVLGGASNIAPDASLPPQAIPGVVGSPISTAITSFSGRYEIPGLMPGTSYVVTITGGISVPRVEKTVTVVAGQWKDPNFVLINTGLLGLPGGPAGGRLELVFPLVSRGGNADIYGVPIETTRIKIQNTGAVRTLASIFWCSSSFAVGGVGTADCGAGDSIDLNPGASVAIAPPAGIFGSALVFTSAPPIGPAPGQSPPGAYSLANLEGIVEYLVGDHQSFDISAGIPAEQLAQTFVQPGNNNVIGMAFKNWNPSTEWNTVVSAMNITNSPQPIVFTLAPTRGVPGGPVQVIRTAPAFGVAILDLRTIPDIPPRWMGAVWVNSSGGIPPIAQIPAPAGTTPAGSAQQGCAGIPASNIGAFGPGNQPTASGQPTFCNATVPLQLAGPGPGNRSNLFVPGGITSEAISYSNRAQMATSVPSVTGGQLVFANGAQGSPVAGFGAIGQTWVLPLVYNGFDGWETGVQLNNLSPGGGSQALTIEVFNENGQQIETITDRIANISGATLFFGSRNAPDYKVGVIRIRPTDASVALGVTAQVVNYARGMAFSYNAFMSLNTSVINLATGAQDVTVALGNETCIGINQPATYIGGQPLQLPVAQCLYVPSVRKDVSIDPDTGRVRLGWTTGIRVMHGDDYQPIPIQLTIRYFDPSGFEWTISREAVVISSPYQAHTWFLGNTAPLPTGFDGSAIITSTSPRVFGIGTVIDYARPSAVPGQPPADRAGGWNLANAAGFIN